MNWSKVLFTISKWIVDLSIIIAVLGLSLLIYYLATGAGFTVTISLNEGSIGNFEDLDIHVKSTYSHLFSSIQIFPQSYYTIIELNGWIKVLGYLLMFISIGAYVYIAYTFGRIIRSAEKGAFFILENVFRLRLLGFAFIAFSIGDGVFDYFKLNLLNRYFIIDHSFPNLAIYHLNLYAYSGTFLFGLFTLILAQAFSYGLQLKEEQELTI